ncbi:MAG: transporter substrate-binding domain-containing protein [Kiritimatiellia bacterium]
MMKRIVQFVYTGVIVVIAGLGIWHVNCGQRDFLSPEERSWLQQHSRHISVAPDPRWTPSQTIEEQQIYQGISSDFMALVERKLGVRFLRVHAESWDQVLALEREGKVDVHPVIFQSPERDTDWLFTEPYMRIPVIAVVRASMMERFHPDDIWSLRMSVGHGYGIESFFRSYADRPLQLIPVESDRFGLIKAAMGEIDVMVTDLASASHYIESEGLTNLRLAATLGSLYEFRFASRRDQPVLHRILNKALEQISREERRSIYDRWVVFDTRPFYRSATFWYVAGTVLLLVVFVLVVILGWNAALKKEVSNKTAALQEAQKQLEKRVQMRTAELAQANASLEREIRERAKTAHDLLHVSGNERARIGRELHDSIGQKLVGILYLTRVLAEELDDAQQKESASAYKILGVIEDSLAEMKQIVRGLLPVDILNKGFLAALEALLKETQQYQGIECQLQCDDQDATAEMDNALATNLYRIAQEAISNALKHAKELSRIVVTLQVLETQGILQIENDGIVTTVTPETSAGRGMGIKIMQYRAMLAGGELAIQAGEEGGLRVICRFNPERKEFADSEGL